jgi:glycosyltransferase involved in cell wall biosynthesis
MIGGARILNLMLGKGAGGLEAMALHAHKALETEGAAVMSVGSPGSWLGEAFEAGDSYRPLSIWGPLDLAAPSRLRRLTEAFAPQLVIAHGSRAASLALKAFAGRLPVVVVVHNFRARKDLARASLAICVSHAVQEDVFERFADLRAVVVENFAPLKAGPGPVAHDGPPRIGSIGRLHRNKGYDVLLNAASILKRRDIGFHLTLAGDGPERAALEALAASLGLGDQASFPGWMDSPVEVLKTLDLFVLSSRIEPFGLVVIEAMAYGTPVVATDIDGPRDILAGGQLGRLAPKDDPEAMADAIAAALADSAGARVMAKLAQASALERYSLKAGGARLAAALMPLLKDRRP